MAMRLNIINNAQKFTTVIQEHSKNSKNSPIAISASVLSELYKICEENNMPYVRTILNSMRAKDQENINHGYESALIGNNGNEKNMLEQILTDFNEFPTDLSVDVKGELTVNFDDEHVEMFSPDFYIENITIQNISNYFNEDFRDNNLPCHWTSSVYF